MIVYAVTFEERDLLGRIVEEVAYAFTTRELAERYAVWHNTTDSTAPRTAQVRAFQVLNVLPRLLESSETPRANRPARKRSTGTSPRSGRPGKPEKLTAENIPVIRSRRAAGDRVVDIARDYDCDARSIYAVLSGQTWGWV
jgi:hypothetical protein